MVFQAMDSSSASLKEISGSSKTDSNAHRVVNFFSEVPEGEIFVQNPNISRNKCYEIRLKSSRELGARD